MHSSDLSAYTSSVNQSNHLSLYSLILQAFISSPINLLIFTQYAISHLPIRDQRNLLHASLFFHNIKHSYILKPLISILSGSPPPLPLILLIFTYIYPFHMPRHSQQCTFFLVINMGKSTEQLQCDGRQSYLCPTYKPLAYNQHLV